MRLFYLLIGVIVGIGLAGQAGAQDSLAYNPTVITLSQPTSVDLSAPGGWRLGGFVGYHRLIQEGYGNKSLYLSHGFQSSLTADYFVGRNWGIGLLLGYQSVRVSDQYAKAQSNLGDPFVRLFPLTSLHSFMMTVGPAVSLPLGRRLFLDINLRGGLFFNDAPVLGTYTSLGGQEGLPSGTLISATIPSPSRFRLGFNGFAGLKYQLTQPFSVGLGASASLSSFEYTQVNNNSENYFEQKQVNFKTVGVQLVLSYRFSTVSRRSKAVPVRPPVPVCYPPVLDQTQSTVYEVGTGDRPVFKWRSSAPVYTEGERFTFRLYTLPGNKVLYEKEVQEPQLTWPDQLSLPDTASYYFYTIHASRKDEFEQSCRSELVVGTFGFMKPQSTPVARPREPVNLYTTKLYELRAVQVVQVTGGPTPPAEAPKPVPPAARRSATGRNRSASPSVIRTDSVLARLKIVPTLVYEEATPQPNFVWPTRLAWPAQAGLYRYVVNRMGTGELVQNYYLMIEPDGCHTIISEATRNKYLRNHSEPPEPQPEPEPKPEPQPEPVSKQP